jgi:hypothetical protein
MNRREQIVRRTKKQNKGILKKEEKSAYRFLIFFMIASVANWIFWHDQFLYQNFKYDLVFIVLPLIIGVYVYYRMNKHFIHSLLQTKSSGFWDSILSAVFLVVTALFFAFCIGVTVADAIFKLSMDLVIKDKSIIDKTYIVDSTFRNDTGKGMHIFSTIRYLNETNEIELFDVPQNAVVTSNEKRKVTFRCKEGFWGYYKIVNYKLK